jgi:hypothetical protein
MAFWNPPAAPSLSPAASAVILLADAADHFALDDGDNDEVIDLTSSPTDYDAAQLKALCKLPGLSQAGTKAELIVCLAGFSRTLSARKPRFIILLDIGRQNMAHTIMTLEGQLVDWANEPLDLPAEFKAKQYAMAVSNYCRRFNAWLPDALVVIERQLLKTDAPHHMTHHMTLTATLQAILESIFHACFLNHRCISVSPVLVSAKFDLSTGNLKKKSAIQKVNQMLRDYPSISTLEQRAYFHGAIKKDDLADSFLQSCAAVQWVKNAYQNKIPYTF